MPRKKLLPLSAGTVCWPAQALLCPKPGRGVVLAAGSRYPLAHPACDVLLDRKKILQVGRALLCRVSREK